MIRLAFLVLAILSSGVVTGCASAPKRVLVGQGCQGEAVRLYGLEDGPEAAKACKSVAIHALP